MAKRADMDSTGRQGKPLFILAGEDHESSQHYLHHILLLEALKSVGRHTAIAYEQPYDLLARFYTQGREYEMRPDILAALVKADHESALSLKLRFYEAENPFAYFAHKTLAYYVLQRFAAGDDLSFISSDVSYDGDEIIEYADPKAVAAMQLCLESPNDMFHLSSPQGMKVRNTHMATFLHQRAYDTDAALCIQFCGKAHINGDFKDNAPKDGLAQNLKRMGADVLALSLQTDAFAMPHQGLSSAEVVECNMPLGPVVEYDPRFTLTTRKPDTLNSGELRSKTAEAAYLEDHLMQFGMHSSILDIDKYETLKVQYRADVQAQYEKIRSAETYPRSGSFFKLKA
tara:strand:+ start:191508 stop:192536 length:1029 start_codon:yes stop_codon:yes gene_type:complete